MTTLSDLLKHPLNYVAINDQGWTPTQRAVDIISEEATITTNETVGPNAADWDDTCEFVEETLHVRFAQAVEQHMRTT